MASLLNKPVAAVVADQKSTADNSDDSNGDIKDFRRSGENTRKKFKPPVKQVVSEDESSSSSEDEAWENAKGVKKFLVLKPETAGAPRGVKGLKVAAGFGLGEDGKLYFALTVGNFSTVEFGAPFALQFNKNAWGLAPEQSLLRKAPGSIPAGVFFETAVEVVKRDANKAGSDNTIQVALKTSLDVFYFAVPIDTISNSL